MLQLRTESTPDVDAIGAENEPAPAPADGLPTPRRIWAIAAISFGTALFVVDGAIANVALPTIARDLAVSNSAVTNVVTVYQLAMVMVLLPFATIGDRIGHRKLYQYGQVLFCLASAAAFLATDIWTLLAVRAAQAIGAGIALSVSAAMVRSIYPARNLGTGMGVNSVIVATSYAIAPTLGGFITQHLDWHWVFVSAAPLALVSLAIGRTLPAPQPRPMKIDWTGGAWSALTVLLLIGGLAAATHERPAPGLAAIAFGAASAVFLARFEWRRERPVLPVDLMAMPAIGLSIVAAIAAFIATTMLMVALPFRFEQGMGYTPSEVGLLLLPYPLTMLVVAPAAGWLSDHISPSVLGMIGMAVTIVGLAFIATLSNDAGPLAIGWRLSLAALGFGLFLSPNSRLIIGQAPRDRAAAAGGLLATARLFGQSSGAALIGLVLALGLGLGPVPAFTAIALCILAAGCSAYRFRATGATLIRKHRQPDLVR